MRTRLSAGALRLTGRITLMPLIFKPVDDVPVFKSGRSMRRSQHCIRRELMLLAREEQKHQGYFFHATGRQAGVDRADESVAP